MQTCSFVLALIALASTSITAQKRSLSVPSAAGPIAIDGKMDEPSWQLAEVSSSFTRNFPDDQATASYQTSVRLLFDKENLYAFLRMDRNAASAYSVSTLREDFEFYENDAVGLILDPFNDFTNGYGFYINAFGARRDEQISNGTFPDPTIDLKWKAEVNRFDDHYTIEVSIPLKFIRHGDGSSWNFNIVRNDSGANERSAWVRVPINFFLNNLAFSGTMNWATADLHATNRLYSVIPSLTLAAAQEGSSNYEATIKPSVDAKLALSSALNLDLTVNPDFSQAQIDQLQVNLTRFELEFPENRFFFIENSDLFSNFGDASWGNAAVRPFYSRKIGLRYDSSSASYLPRDILGGMRLSGKINNNLRFGAMSMFTRQENISESQNIPSQNYSVVAIQQKLFTRSNVAVMLTGRQAFGNDSTNFFSFNHSDYNRVLATEYNFASRDDAFSGKFYYHSQFDPAIGNSEYAAGALFRHNTRKWRNWFQTVQVTDDFRPDAGFVPRTNVLSVNTHIAYSIYPEKGKVNQWEFIVNPQFFMNANGSYSDHFLISGLHWIKKNTQDFWIVHIQERIALKSPFDPTFENSARLDSGLVTTFDYARMAYGSDKRKKIYWSIATDIGKYYTGNQVRADGEVGYRLQPHGIIGLNYNVGRFVLPDPFKPANLTYIAPKFEYAFTKKIFLTSVVQYRSQGNNLNYYLRLQWRFGALSDFFIVYSHNRDTEASSFKSHSLVFKTVIWI